MPNTATIRFRRRHLPHWIVAERTHFVTFRLKGSLPRHVIETLRAEREAFLAGSPNELAIVEFQAERFAKVEAILDSAVSGARLLHLEAAANVVLDAFAWLQAVQGWRTHALTIMPNHVHVLLRNDRGRSHLLNHHLGVVKGYTARVINRLLRRQGALWMDENFDHWCRSDGEMSGYVEYIRQNPVKAGLVKCAEEWPWTRVSGQ